MNDETIAKLADLAVRVGANVQPDQVVSVAGEPHKEYLTRAVAGAAYRAGARFVDVQWFDPWVKRERIAHAREETLEFVPPWYGERMLALGDHRAARIAFSGPTAPGILDDLDPVRAGKDRLPAIKESVKVLADRTTNWSIVPGPNPAGPASSIPTWSRPRRWRSCGSRSCTSAGSTRTTRRRRGPRAPTSSRPRRGRSPSAASTRCTTRARAPT